MIYRIELGQLTDLYKRYYSILDNSSSLDSSMSRTGDWYVPAGDQRPVWWRFIVRGLAARLTIKLDSSDYILR